MHKDLSRYACHTGRKAWKETMSIHRIKPASKVAELIEEPGRHPDGGGLYLQVAAPGQASWVYRFPWEGKERWMSLGPAALITLDEVRDRHHELRKLRKAGTDPRTTAIAKPAKAAGATFGGWLDKYLATASPYWRGGADGKEAVHYRKSFDRIPDFLELSIPEVTPDAIRTALEAWDDQAVTQRKMKFRIGGIVNYAMTGDIRSLKKKTMPVVINHPALPFARVPEFMRELIALYTIEARALMFTILTATRSERTLMACWGEIGEVVDNPGEAAKPTWIRSAEIMKTPRDHRIPLTPEAIGLLGPRGADDALVFPGHKKGHPLAAGSMRKLVTLLQGDGEPRWIDEKGLKITVHGFRTSFRTWINDKTDYNENKGALGEFALHHAVGLEIQRIYNHGDALEKRRDLMRDWAVFCTGGTP
jgi:integrase